MLFFDSFLLCDIWNNFSNLQSRTENQSTWNNFWKKVKILSPFLWPRKDFFLQLRVIFCFILLAGGRVVNLYVPIYQKLIGKCYIFYYKNILFSLLVTGTFENGQWCFIIVFVFELYAVFSFLCVLCCTAPRQSFVDFLPLVIK